MHNHRLSPTQKLILALVSQESQPLSMGRIIDRSIVHPATADRAVATLLTLGLLERHKDGSFVGYTVSPSNRPPNPLRRQRATVTTTDTADTAATGQEV